MNKTPMLAVSNRLRSTPFTGRLQQQGVSAFTVYNHMLLPAEFASLEEDYWHLCEHVQVWDVGAERQVSIKGKDAGRLVQWMTPRDIRKTDIGRCVYVPLADEQGMMLNDPLALKLAEDHWWLSMADSDVLLWAKGLATGANMDVTVSEPEVWPLAVQGPKADQLMTRVFGAGVMDIRFFRFAPMNFNDHAFLVARSGWSKQGGYEIYIDDAATGLALYDALFEAGAEFEVRPGCPNLIERLEGGLLSFGNDMTLQHTVLECGLDRFFSLDHNAESLSLAALRQQKAQGLERKLLGLALPAADRSYTLKSAGTPPFLINETGELVGRLGSQAWSPRHQIQLATVMLEKPFLNKSTLKLQLHNDQLATAQVVDLPFDFTLPVLNPKSRHAPSRSYT